MIHICGDEIMMLMALLPWVGGVFLWLKMKFGRKVATEKCDGCGQHVHHPCCEYNAAIKLDSGVGRQPCRVLHLRRRGEPRPAAPRKEGVS